MGPSWGHLGACWAHLGAISGPSWAIVGPLGPTLGPSFGHLGPFWCHLGSILGPWPKVVPRRAPKGPRDGPKGSAAWRVAFKYDMSCWPCFAVSSSLFGHRRWFHLGAPTLQNGICTMPRKLAPPCDARQALQSLGSKPYIRRDGGDSQGLQEQFVRAFRRCLNLNGGEREGRYVSCWSAL